MTARNGQSDQLHMAAPLYTSGTSSGPGARKGRGSARVKEIRMVNLDRGEGQQVHLIATPGPHEQYEIEINYNSNIFQEMHFKTYIVITSESLSLSHLKTIFSSVQQYKYILYMVSCIPFEKGKGLSLERGFVFWDPHTVL